MKFSTLKSLIITIVSISFMQFTCYTKDEIEHRLLIVNNLPDNIYCITSSEYPDTTLDFTSREVILANDGAYGVLANSSERIGYGSLCYQTEWKIYAPSDTLILFVFDQDVVNNNSWEYIKTNNKYLRRYFLSYGDISGTCSWTVK